MLTGPWQCAVTDMPSRALAPNRQRCDGPRLDVACFPHPCAWCRPYGETGRACCDAPVPENRPRWRWDRVRSQSEVRASTGRPTALLSNGQLGLASIATLQMSSPNSDRCAGEQSHLHTAFSSGAVVVAGRCSHRSSTPTPTPTPGACMGSHVCGLCPTRIADRLLLSRRHRGRTCPSWT